MSTKFKLGQKVRITAYRYKTKDSKGTHWVRTIGKVDIQGIVIGKRTVAEGYTEYYEDYHEFVPTRHLSLYLVAKSLTTAYHVAEEDMEVLDDNA